MTILFLIASYFMFDPPNPPQAGGIQIAKAEGTAVLSELFSGGVNLNRKGKGKIVLYETPRGG